MAIDSSTSSISDPATGPLPIPPALNLRLPDAHQASESNQSHTSEAVAHHAVSRAARSVYGLLLVLTVLEAMEVHPPHEKWAGPELLFGTLLTVALFEIYADAIAGTFVRDRHFSRAELGHASKEAIPVLVGVPLPLAVLALSAFGIIGITRAIDAALIFAYSTLLIYFWWMSRKVAVSQAARLIAGLSLLLLAFLLVGLKSTFH